MLPNIYVDGNRSKRGLVLDLKAAGDRARLRDLVAASDVVVENAMAGVRGSGSVSTRPPCTW